MYKPLLLLTLASCAPKVSMPTTESNTVGYQLVETGSFMGSIEVNRFQYDNGLTLIVASDHSAPVVAYQTWFGVGSSHEVKTKTGLAHLFEHMMFKGTESYEEGHYDKTLDALGADGLNAWTWLDETTYIQSVPTVNDGTSENANQALRTLAELEATRMTQLLVNEESLASELEVVMNERRLRVDNNPDGKLNEQLYATAFEVHTYGWPTIGWMADLEGIVVNDCIDFYNTWYAPNNASIVMVGDIKADEAASMIYEVYGALEPSTIPDRTPPVEPEQTEQRRFEMEVPTAADRIQVGFKAPGAGAADLPALLVLDAILTSGRSGTLIRSLQDTGIASEVGSFLMGMKYPGLWEFSLTAREGIPAQKLEESLFAALADVRSSGVSATDVERGIHQVQAATWEEMESNSGKADMIGWNWLASNDWKAAEANQLAIKQVTVEDVNRVAQTYLEPNRSTVAIGRATQSNPDAAPPTLHEVPTTPDFTPPSARSEGEAPSLARGDRTTEKVHGADLLMIYDPTSPLLRLNIGFGAGSAVETIPGTAYLTGLMVSRGTESIPRAAFEEALERLGASLTASVGPDHIEFHMSVPATAWPEAIALLRQAMNAPGFDKEEIDKLKEEVRNQFVERLDNDRALASRTFSTNWYGADHPYGRSVMGTAETLDNITQDDLRKFHQDWMRSSIAVVGLGGAFDAKTKDDLIGLLADRAGSVPEAPVIPNVTPPQGRRTIIVDKPERTQVQALVGFQGADHTSESYPAVLLGNDVVAGGSFQARLMKEVRVERGWSYYAYGRNNTQQAHPSYIAALAPGVEYAVDAAALVLDVFSQAKTTGATAEELEQARSSRIKSAPFLSDTTDKRLNLEFEKLLNQVDHVGYVEKMGNLTLEETNQALNSLYDPENALIVLVATAEEIKEKAAELGNVTVVSFKDVQ